MDPCRCVVIELELTGEDRFINYLLVRKNDYNWILRESMEDPSKVKACVWWCRNKEFFNTPLRSFLKRLKNKHVPGLKVSGKMATEKGVQLVCKGIPGTIIKYHLGPPLYRTLRRLLQVENTLFSNETPPPISKDGDGGCDNSILGGILQKLDDLLDKFTGLRESMVRDVYSQYDPPWSYPDIGIAQAHEEAREARREAEGGEGH